MESLELATTMRKMNRALGAQEAYTDLLNVVVECEAASRESKIAILADFQRYADKKWPSINAEEPEKEPPP